MSYEEIKKALEGVTPERVERMWWFLHIIAKSTGTTNAEDDKWNWINAFCTDYEDDTFNLAAKLGFISVRHDSFMETSTARITKAGMALVAHFDKAPSAALTSTLESLQRDNAILQERTADYPTISAKLHDREKARDAEQKACREAIARAKTAEAEVKRLRGVLSFYSCDGSTCDCIPGQEDANSVTCGFRARTALASTGGEHHAE